MGCDEREVGQPAGALRTDQCSPSAEVDGGAGTLSQLRVAIVENDTASSEAIGNLSKGKGSLAARSS